MKNKQVEQIFLEENVYHPLIIGYIEQLEKGKQIPKINEKYYFISGYDTVMMDSWFNTDVDYFRYDNSITFETFEECEKAMIIRRAFKEASFIPNWEDNKQEKWSISYSNRLNKFGINVSNTYNHNALYYFESREIAQQLIDKFSKEDILKYIFNV